MFALQLNEKTTFNFTPETVSIGLGGIHRVYHDTFFPGTELLELNLEALGTEGVYNDDFVVVELRTGVMILRRGLRIPQGVVNQPYAPMETRQTLAHREGLTGDQLEIYANRMAQAIIEAAATFSYGGELAELAVDTHPDHPAWRPAYEEEVHHLIQQMVAFTQASRKNTLNIRFSRDTGLTLSVRVDTFELSQVPKGVLTHPLPRQPGRFNAVVRARF